MDLNSIGIQHRDFSQSKQALKNTKGEQGKSVSPFASQFNKAENKEQNPHQARNQKAKDQGQDRALYQKQSSQDTQKNIPVNKSKLHSEKNRIDLAEKANAQKEVESPLNNRGKTAQVSTSNEIEDLTPVEEKAILVNFLKKMESEVGVKPEEVISAFGALSTQELLSPPKESLDSLVTALNLEPQKKEKATALFEQMLGLQAANEMAHDLEKNNQNLAIDIKSQEENRQEILKSSIDTMASQFFMRNEINVPKRSSQVVAQAYQQQTPKLETMLPSNMGAMPQVIEDGSDGNGVEVLQKSVAGEQILNANNLEQELVNPDFASKVPRKNIAMNAYGNQAKIDISSLEKPADNIDLSAITKSFQEQQLNIGEKTNIAPDENSYMKAMAQPAASMEMMDAADDVPMPKVDGMNFDANNVSEEMMMASQKSSEGDLEGGEQQSDSQPENLFTALNNKKSVDEGVQTQKRFVMNNLQPSETNVAENSREIINQAKLLMNRGGGEMKVVLTPEGMGEVNLKVAMKNGQVNVEMIADTKEAKSLIEKGIGDLKSTLVSQKLNVEDIKVDVNSDLAKDLTQEQNQAEKQFQQKFLQDFQQRNKNFRNTMLDINDFGSRKATDENQVQSLLEQSAKPKKAAKGRLNLVA